MARLRFLALLPLACAAPVSAELPQPVRAMVEAAIATGDAAKVGIVVEIAKQTNPDDVAEIDALHAVFQTRQNELAAAEKVSRKEEIRAASALANWSGRGQVGAFQASGNSDYVGATLALALERKGAVWEHRFRANVDYQRSSGETSREQYLAAYEPRYQIDESLFAYGLAQYERDRFQGFSSRYSLSGGFGYKVIDSADAQLSLKAGPSWRRVDFLNGVSEESLGGLAGLDFDWQLARTLKFTQDADLVADAGGQATVLIDANNTSVLVTSGLEAAVTDRVTTRLSYTVDYDSNPPTGAVSTDTLTRFTLVYGF